MLRFLIPPVAVIIDPRAFFTRASKIYFQFPAAQTLAIEPFNGLIRFFLSIHRYKCKSLETTRVTVFDESNLIDRSYLGKQTSQIIIGCFVGKIPYI